MFDKLPTDLETFRTHLGVSPREMADLMGMPMAEYLGLELGHTALTPLHVKAAYFASIVVAARARSISALSYEVAALLDGIR